jgi:hypothetical protein
MHIASNTTMLGILFLNKQKGFKKFNLKVNYINEIVLIW